MYCYFIPFYVMCVMVMSVCINAGQVLLRFRQVKILQYLPYGQVEKVAYCHALGVHGFNVFFDIT